MKRKNSDKWMDKLIDTICDSYKNESYHRMDSSQMPSICIVIKILQQIKQILFPGYYAEPGINKNNVNYFVGDLLNEVMFNLSQEIYKSFLAIGKRKNRNQCSIITKKFLNSIPKIRDLLKKDVKAAMDGDPAAKSIPEVIISYPCVDVITVYRIAHELYKLSVPLIPRIMTETSHSKTGVDIHPGATIGEYFFIDHGTGVVIGETTIIGKYVKIYQGVTLGALSFPKDKKGKLIKGLKRHPTIEDNVTIYANATILGGNTIIGKNSVVGGNAWIVQSIKPGTKVK